MADSIGLFIVLMIFCFMSIISSIFFTYTCTDGTWDFGNFEGEQCVEWPEKDKTDPVCSTFTTQSDCPSRCSWDTATSSCGEPSPPPGPAPAPGPSTSPNFTDALAEVLPEEEVVAYSAGLNPACGPIPGKGGTGLTNICNIRTSQVECESDQVSQSTYTRIPGAGMNSYYTFKEVCKWDQDKQQLIKDAEAQATADAVGAVTCTSKGTPTSRGSFTGTSDGTDCICGRLRFRVLNQLLFILIPFTHLLKCIITVHTRPRYSRIGRLTDLITFTFNL